MATLRMQYTKLLRMLNSYLKFAKSMQAGDQNRSMTWSGLMQYPFSIGQASFHTHINRIENSLGYRIKPGLALETDQPTYEVLSFLQ